MQSPPSDASQAQETAILDQIDERAGSMAGAVWPDAQPPDYSRIDGGARLTPHCAYGE